MAEANAAVAFRFEVGDDGLRYHIDNDAVAAIGLAIFRGWRRWAYDTANRLKNYLPTTRLTLVAVPSAIAAYQFGQFPWAVSARSAVDARLFMLPPNYRIMLTSTIIYIGCAFGIKKMLKCALRYNGFMYDKPKKISLTTRVWALSMKALAIVRPTTFVYQHVLPKLPLPSLRNTLRRYLASVKPLLSDEEYQRMEAESQDFARTLGWKLQWYLWAKHLFVPNYVTDWWETYVYLYWRNPIMINSNYYGLDCVFSSVKATQAARAANMTAGLLKFRTIIDHQNLKPLMAMGIRPLCSAQYERAFNTTRIPGREFDTLKKYHRSEHIAVYHRGRWFQMPIYKGYGILPPKDLETLFKQILASPIESLPGEEKCAAFTSWKRDEWARCRENYFLSNPTNRKSLGIIESAAFVVILEDKEAGFDKDDYVVGDAYAAEALHGNGYNKWFDKSMTLTVFSNGKVCVNAEHSWADAPVTCQSFEFSYYQDFKIFGYDEHGNCSGEPSELKLAPMKLQWDFSPECIKDIDLAVADAQTLIADTDIRLMLFDDYGKGFIKTCKCSPDGFIQLALQLAYYRDIGKFHLTYEASMTRLYREGRTETVRACTPHTCDFVLALENGTPYKSKKELRDMIWQSCDFHSKLYRDAMAGKGVDRHLFCLYVVSKYLKKDHDFLKKVIEEPWRLSTSQTPQVQMGFVDLEKNPEFRSPGGGFGPVSFDGYGVSYIIAGEDNIWFHVSSRNSSTNTDSHRFRGRIRQALLDMKDLYVYHDYYDE